MRSLVFTRHGEPADVLSLVDVDDPAAPGPGDVLIRVTKRLIHPGDLSLVRGHFPGDVPPGGSTPGFEGVGLVEAVGQGVDPARGVRPGARVVFFPGAGGWGERIKTSAVFVAPVADDISDAIACQLLVNTITALLLLRAAERAAPGRSGRETPIVLTAAGSAVARILTSMALKRGLRIVSVVRSRDGAGSLLARFPELPVVTTADPEWREQVRRAADDRPLDVVIDPVGGALANDLVDLLGDGASLLFYGGLAHEPISLPSILLTAREVTLKGVSIKRWLENSSPEQRRDDVAEALAIGRSAPDQFNVAGDFDLADFAEALEAAEAAARPGPILLSSNL